MANSTDASTDQRRSIDKEALLRKYREERDKRLRPDGNAQYLELKGQLAHFADDPYTPVKPREPKRDHVTFAFIGGGFAGLVTGARLAEAGIADVRIIEKGGDFGGTWYWNRYPGAQCDTASMIYMPLLEETGHMPSEKYARAPEILAQCQRIAHKYGLYENALLHTVVRDVVWDAENAVWTIRTDRGDEFTAQFVGMGTGPLHVAKLPGIPGIDSFKGHSFHTSRWDYAYTGGDPGGALMSNLRDKRVGIIGTGATSVQAVPHLSRACKELFVFQRTPSSVDIRNNAPIEADWFKSVAEPGWQRKWLMNFTEYSTGMAEVDLVQDGWTDVSRRIRERLSSKRAPGQPITMADRLSVWEDADFEKMEEIRARVDSVVKDAETAAKLKAWYRQFCKRPCFHDEYLDAFNNPSTHLVDTDGKGVERITENGVVVAGVEYPLDCIIYASGFEVGTDYKRRAGFDVTGVNGTMSDYWADGMRSLHGAHVHGFPNLFLVQPAQGANLISNVPHNLTESGATIAAIVRHALDRGAKTVEVTREAEDAWMSMLLAGGGRMPSAPDCTPGYYNNEGQGGGMAARYNVGYPQGPGAYFRYLEKWRDAGTFDGLAFT